MAKIEELVRQISDTKLRDEIATEIKELKKQKRFGLVFEEHLPEMLRLPKAKIRLGNLVAHRDAPGSEVWRVLGINGKKAKCRQPITSGKYDQEVIKEFSLDELVLVVSFGEPIYPILTPIDRVQRGGPNKPWHVLINADNYHALQLLLYSHERKVDLIYIDPPYNTGARDWKYNNDYVDKTDSWRHSKWLSMIKKRLVLAKRLLHPTNGVLIVTIDENEVYPLGLLLQDVFRGMDLQMATVIINPGGTFGNNLSSVHEYMFVCVPAGKDLIKGRPLSKKEIAAYDRSDDFGAYQLGRLRKRGVGSLRTDNKSMFYPVYVEPQTLEVKGVGSKMDLNERPNFSPKDGLLAVYPIDEKGVERRWNYGHDTMKEEIAKGEVIAEKDRQGRVKIYKKERVKALKKLPSVWTGGQYAAGDHGSKIVNSILNKPNAFPFPKSIYTVHDSIAAVCSDRPNAIILDFFAGSGTTYHATCMLNALLGGTRTSILVTNNEVPENVQKELSEQGLFPGDEEFEKKGLAQSVTWPRCKYVTLGSRDDGSSLSGEYLEDSVHGGRMFAEGFDENIDYFRLDFVDPASVERGDAFEGILPILWLMAGAIGERESRRGATAWYIAKHSPFAVLIQETKFRDFQKELRERQDVRTIFLVTDSDDNFGLMRRELGRRYHCVQLYKSYLENFRINTVDRHAARHDEESE